MPAQTALDPIALLGIPHAALPRHIAVIMDGNGRWALQRSRPRIIGHRHGVKAVRVTITHCARLGIDCLTLYSFSAENWKRPPAEVAGLMSLYSHYLRAERADLLENNIRVVLVGRRDGLPARVIRELDRTIEATSNCTGMTLGLALNYGARTEIVDAVRCIARRVRDGELSMEQIDERLISDSLYTAGMPDPDLVIRTANESRISNFLLWQISYAEFFVTPTLWPDFSEANIHEALRSFVRRDRRFGGVRSPEAP